MISKMSIKYWFPIIVARFCVLFACRFFWLKGCVVVCVLTRFNQPFGWVFGAFLGGRLTAFRPTAVGAALAAAGVDDLPTAVGTGFAGLGAVLDVAFQCTGHTVGPSGDAVDVEVQFADEVHHIGDGHAMAQDTADELGIVPVLFLEHARKALHGDVVAVLVEELEVVAGVLVSFFFDAYHPAFLHPFGQDEVLRTSGENLVRTVFVHAHHSNPVLFLVLETDHLGLQFLGTFGCLVLVELVVVAVLVLAFRYEYTVARPVAVDGAALAARFPCRLIDCAYYFLRGFLRDVDGDADGMVYPFLDGSLHFYFVHPVDVGRGGFVVG